MSRRKIPSPSLAGILPVDKPAGPTSHDVVVRARRALGERRIGHTGTLDPFATGLLLLCVGPATRLSAFFQRLPKSYRAVIRLGEETDTDDPTGSVVRATDSWRSVTELEVRSQLERMEGEMRQVPPAYSAKKVAGQRAFEAARAGRSLTLPAKAVTVHRAVLLEYRPPDVHAEFVVSAGTYVRALARDLGRELACMGHLAALRRTSIAPFHVDSALAWTDLITGAGPASALVSCAEAVSWMPRRELTEEESKRVSTGQPLERGQLARPDLLSDELATDDSDAWVALVRNGHLVSIAASDGEWLKPKRVFREE